MKTTPTEFGLQPNKSIPYHYSCKSFDDTRFSPGALTFAIKTPRKKLSCWMELTDRNVTTRTGKLCSPRLLTRHGAAAAARRVEDWHRRDDWYRRSAGGAPTTGLLTGRRGRGFDVRVRATRGVNRPKKKYDSNTKDNAGWR